MTKVPVPREATAIRSSKITWVLNLNCQLHDHAKCPGASRGPKTDPVTYACTCPCHGWDRLPLTPEARVRQFLENKRHEEFVSKWREMLARQDEED